MHNLERLLLAKVDEIIDQLLILQWRIRTMSKELDDLTAQVTTNTTVIQGAVVLIQGLRQQIIDAGTDPAALKALTDSLGASDVALAAALVANTPTPPLPPVAP